MTYADVERLLELPARDRMNLVEVLWDSLREESSDDTAWSQDERRLIETRLAAYRAAPEDLLDWSEVKPRVLEESDSRNLT